MAEMAGCPGRLRRSAGHRTVQVPRHGGQCHGWQGLLLLRLDSARDGGTPGRRPPRAVQV